MLFLFCRVECLVYSSESKNFTAYLPLNVRANKSLGNVKNEITFRMRHTGKHVVGQGSKY